MMHVRVALESTFMERQLAPDTKAASGAKNDEPRMVMRTPPAVGQSWTARGLRVLGKQPSTLSITCTQESDAETETVRCTGKRSGKLIESVPYATTPPFITIAKVVRP